jgi:hypothetical protein
MKPFNPTERLAPRAAIAAAACFVAIALFQLVLAVGAPLGHAAWGGAHANLSTAERVGSAIAMFVWSGAALILLGRAGLRPTRVPSKILRRATWTLVGLSLIAAIMNFASPSQWENLIFGPLALLLATLCTIVARSDLEPQQHPTAARSLTRRAGA